MNRVAEYTLSMMWLALVLASAIVSAGVTR